MNQPRNHGKRGTPAARKLMLDAWITSGRIGAVARYVGRSEVAVMSELGDLLAAPSQGFRDVSRGGGRRVSAEPTPRPAESGQRWTPEEEDLLRSLAGYEPAEEIGAQIGRSVGAVYSRMRKLSVDPSAPAPEMCEWDWQQIEDWMGVTLR